MTPNLELGISVFTFPDGFSTLQSIMQKQKGFHHRQGPELGKQDDTSAKCTKNNAYHGCGQVDQ